MTETELRTMIDEGKSLSEIASEMAAGEYDVCSRETLLSYAISEIENDRLFLARHLCELPCRRLHLRSSADCK